MHENALDEKATHLNQQRMRLMMSIMKPQLSVPTLGFSTVRKSTLWLFSVAVLLAGGTPAVRGQPTLDSFNPNANGTIDVVVVQPDGKILIGGFFTIVAGVTRNRIARLNPDGTIDTGFNPNSSGQVVSMVLQSDGKILAGGGFSTIGGQTRTGIARLDPVTGLADSWNANANGGVFSIAVQSDGKILAGGGGFTSIGGLARTNIARLDASTGAADPTWDPEPNSTVYTIAVQSDGKILVGGAFISGLGTPTIGGQTRNNIARLDPTTGFADSFNPNANEYVYSIVVQSDGKIVVGGLFKSLYGTPTIGGQTRNNIARLDPTNGLADSFDPNANNLVYSIAVQSDGKILAGGQFTTVSPNGGAAVTRNNIVRLNPDGTADSWDPNANNIVRSIVLQADGKILVAGQFTTLSPNGGAAVTRNRIARFATLQPLLNIQPSAHTNVVLSWATNFTGFTLEAKTNLTTNFWSTVTPAPAITGSNNVVTNTITGAARFYRLRQ